MILRIINYSFLLSANHIRQTISASYHCLLHLVRFSNFYKMRWYGYSV
jgi:hypothetical protein